jgi:predicted Zn-dependent peptidase
MLTAAAPGPKELGLRVQRARLKNGLRVVLNEDHASPTVAVCVTYDVGSRNESKGRSGFAHLFEHMMFQGSRNVAKGDHFTLIASRGGTLNGTTSSDRTNYFQLLPSNALELGLWLEADRMKTLAVTQENFENQRSVVQEEFRMRVSNAPYATGQTRMRELAFKDYWPYEHDPIGSMEDLDAAKLEWIREFHRGYYAPNNAVLTISGDFDPARAMALVHTHFADATQSEVPAYTPPPAPNPQIEPRVAEVTDKNARTPGLYLGWVIPPFREPEHYALELAGVILGYGDSSALHQKLVQDDASASNVVTWTYDHRGPDLFVVRAILSETGKVEGVQTAIRKELDRLATVGPSGDEVQKAKQRLQSFFLFGLEGNMDRATQLSNYELYYGDARLLGEELKYYFAVTPDQIQKAAQKYLGADKSSTVVVQPMNAASGPQANSHAGTPSPEPLAARSKP